ncbi:dTDP-4-dehydrorhamnose reductase [Limnoraphis robusta]|uniref:dTDP-4-dehydrorhamnose reductase n=1 Tax=Limnoraphis robusta CCNP1315 TaxID=3110306 RepID=A0ABU5TWH6_9CYAN|nr:dTDP-4-dehydrorhamnose reductase [Limnoraphis robusta]MEA5518323.1 dTDP-4-dehydrorhamnose reductase [Limnoraphis robusta CCNP1315]MEA5547704.1 dTDP-4-dehydrorhamnose reductase [Limnoraphis robusta CCNP1324]
MRQILLIGKDGQLGQELQPFLAPLGEVKSFGRESLDLANPEAIAKIVADHKPDLIINAAAYTAVDKAESERELAIAINGTAPGILAKEAQQIGATLIHVSTDYVFDGTQSHPYLETDQTQPLGGYGQSKLAGEQAILKTEANAAIIRTAWVYGVGGKGNFVKTMLRLGAEREELRVVCDQVGSPTWTGDLAVAIAQLSEKINSETTGIYHYTNSGVTSWYDFAVAIFEEAKHLGFPLKIQRVVPISTAEYPTPARRPAYSVLNTQKISAILGTYPPHWRQSLRKMLSELATKG